MLNCEKIPWFTRWFDCKLKQVIILSTARASEPSKTWNTGSFFKLWCDQGSGQTPQMGGEMEYLKGGGRDLISCHFLAIFKSQRAVQETNCWVSDSHEDNINVK